ncbi:hypothetical protein [Leisingera caerulea]|uniref:Uncharacterized protein n=1 Tax=Leisingera caerulea TaxID=506591 RepID=A0A9Q9LXG7_LEICA|nr:hypothetical protein [Leisingera caerulea]UWQ53031.1 hypothetical protein K3721_13570 [Leisingera caerulea]
METTITFHPTPLRVPAFMRSQPPTEFHRFVGENLQALAIAAKILGVTPGQQMVARLVEDLQSDTTLNASTQRVAAGLARLLDPRGPAWRNYLRAQDIDVHAVEFTELERLVREYQDALAQSAASQGQPSRGGHRM